MENGKSGGTIGVRERRDRYSQEREQPLHSMVVRGSVEWLERGLVAGAVTPARLQ